MFSRIAISFSIALFVIVVIELGYLVFFNNKAQFAPPTATTKINADQIIVNGKNLTSYLYYGTRGALIYATVNLVFEGVISEVYKTPGEKINIQYNKGMRLRGINGEQYLLFTSLQVKYLVVYSNFLGVNYRTKFEDLKVGDKVRVEIERDLSKGPSNDVLEIKIYKL